MAKTLSELIADAAANDDLAFTGPDGLTVKLADLRAFSKAADGEKRIAEIKRKEAEAAVQEGLGILEALKKAKEEMNAAQPKGAVAEDADAWKKDPLYAPLVPVFDSLAKQAKESLELAANIKKSLDQSQAIYALERMRRQYAEATVKPKDKTFEQIVQEVVAAKEVDQFGLPTLEKFLYRVTEPDRIKAAADKAVADAKVEWDKAAKAAAVPKPGQFRPAAKKADAPIKNLSELNSEVIANDPDIIAAMEGTVQ